MGFLCFGSSKKHRTESEDRPLSTKLERTAYVNMRQNRNAERFVKLPDSCRVRNNGKKVTFGPDGQNWAAQQLRLSEPGSPLNTLTPKTAANATNMPSKQTKPNQSTSGSIYSQGSGRVYPRDLRSESFHSPAGTYNGNAGKHPRNKLPPSSNYTDQSVQWPFNSDASVPAYITKITQRNM